MARQANQVGWVEPSLLVLGSLAEGPKHGYAIVKDVEATVGISLGPGTLYAALARLEDGGLIEPLAGENRRRPYRLTAEGERVLQERLRSMASFSRLGLRRLSAGGAA